MRRWLKICFCSIKGLGHSWNFILYVCEVLKPIPGDTEGCLCLRPPLRAFMAPWPQCLVLCVSLCFHLYLSSWASDPAPRCSFLKYLPGPSVVSWALCPPPSYAIDLPIMAMLLKLYPVEADSSAIFHRIHGQKVLEWILGLCCKFSLYPEFPFGMIKMFTLMLYIYTLMLYIYHENKRSIQVFLGLS